MMQAIWRIPVLYAEYWDGFQIHTQKEGEGEVELPKAVDQVALIPLTGTARVQLEVNERRESQLVPKVVKLNLTQEKKKVAVLMDVKEVPLRIEGADESMTLVVHRVMMRKNAYELKQLRAQSFWPYQPKIEVEEQESKPAEKEIEVTKMLEAVALIEGTREWWTNAFVAYRRRGQDAKAARRTRQSSRRSHSVHH